MFNNYDFKFQDAQPSTDKLTKFLDAIYVSSVTNLANEAGPILDLILKDSTPLSKLKSALEHMSQVSKWLGNLFVIFCF